LRERDSSSGYGRSGRVEAIMEGFETHARNAFEVSLPDYWTERFG
jgi:hypothetical protein